MAPALPWLRPPAASDIGARFLEHTLLLNDVLLGLVLELRSSETAPLGDLPFRWLCESDEVLEFRALGRRISEAFKAVLKPDAILELPGRGRRLFLEAETGTQSIVTAHPERTGAVVAKLQRYQQFFEGRPEISGKTWYERAFPDALAPRLVFLVHSADRKVRVEKALREAASRPPSRFRAVALTFSETAPRIASYFPARREASRPVRPGQLSKAAAPDGRPAAPSPRAPQATAPAPAPAQRFALAVDERDLRLLRDSYRRMEEALQDAYEVIDEHQKRARCLLELDRLPRYELDYLRKIILGGPSGTPEAAPASQGVR